MMADEIINKYIRELKDKYEGLSFTIQDLLSSILKSNGIMPHSVTNRAKSPDSLKEKITRDSKDYKDPLSEITDLAGVRVITYFPTDVDKIYELIKKEFMIDYKNTIDKRNTAEPTAFGYASLHIVAQLSQKRLKLSEYSTFKNMKCEIQVRTILQHAWAEIEHDIIYKSTEDMPFELRRRFSYLSGILELADREFESLRIDEKKIRKRIENEIKSNKLDIPVNYDSIMFYLKKYHGAKHINPNKITNLIKLLKAKEIKSLNALNKILSQEKLIEADKFMQQKESVASIVCSPTKISECNLRYFVAVGRHFKMSDEGIGDFAGCPIIFQTKLKVGND